METFFFIYALILCSYTSFQNTNVKSKYLGRVYPNDNIINEFFNLKIKGIYQGLVFSIDDKKDTFIIEAKLKRGFVFDELSNYLPINDCRYVIYNFEYTTDENQPRNKKKLILIIWSPAAAPIKRKMIFSESKSNLRKVFTGIGYELNASLLQHITYEAVRNEILAR